MDIPGYSQIKHLVEEIQAIKHDVETLKRVVAAIKAALQEPE